MMMALVFLLLAGVFLHTGSPLVPIQKGPVFPPARSTPASTRAIQGRRLAPNGSHRHILSFLGLSPAGLQCLERAVRKVLLWHIPRDDE